MLEPFKNRALLLKTETVEGTDAAPAPGADAFQLFDGTSGLTSDKVERAIDRPFFGGRPFVNTNLRGFVEGGFEVAPPAIADGTSKAAIDALLRIAGMAKTYAAGPPKKLTYNPISTAFPSGTAWFYHAGTLRKMTGSRANISSIALEIGNYLRGQCRIEGNCQDVDEASLPGGLDYSAFAAPPVISTETMLLTYNGVTVEGKRIAVDMANQLRTIEHSEARLSRITDRMPTFSTLAYRAAKASFDPYALWKAGTIIPIVGTVTDPVTNRVTTMTVRGQIEDVRDTDIDGDFGYEITGRCIPSDTGGDEVLIAFTAP